MKLVVVLCIGSLGCGACGRGDTPQARGSAPDAYNAAPTSHDADGAQAMPSEVSPGDADVAKPAPSSEVSSRFSVASLREESLERQRTFQRDQVAELQAVIKARRRELTVKCLRKVQNGGGEIRMELSIDPYGNVNVGAVRGASVNESSCLSKLIEQTHVRSWEPDLNADYSLGGPQVPREPIRFNSVLSRRP